MTSYHEKKEYLLTDHHVKRISIDLSDTRLNGTEIIVEPHLNLNDNDRKHTESLVSSIFITVIAIIGEGNPYFHMISEVKAHSIIELPQNTVFVKSTLTTADVQYPAEDHHVWKYWTQITPVIEGNRCTLVGEAKLQDNGSNSGSGIAKGSVFVYAGNPQNVMCVNFDSRKLRGSGNLCFGKAPDDFQEKDYDLVCFVNRYDVSFESSDKDHHVLKVEVAANLINNCLIKDENKIYAKLELKSFLTDNGEHKFDIPHNSVSGFVIAIKNK